MRRLIFLILVLSGVAAFIKPISKARDFQIFGQTISHVETSTPIVALTLDDGPSPGHTQAVLAILAQYDVPATFFVLGQHLEQRPDLARLIVDAGHELGNHSYTHARMILKTPAWVRDELDRTDANLRVAGQEGPIQFRPPYGQKLISLPWVLAKQGRPSIMWDVTTASSQDDPQLIAAHIIANTQPGSIILMHVMYDLNAPSRDALPRVIAGLQARGFRFVLLRDLLAHQTANNRL